MPVTVGLFPIFQVCASLSQAGRGRVDAAHTSSDGGLLALREVE
jgi:hypothetical protein